MTTEIKTFEVKCDSCATRVRYHDRDDFPPPGWTREPKGFYGFVDKCPVCQQNDKRKAENQEAKSYQNGYLGGIQLALRIIEEEPTCDCGKIEHGRHHSECPANPTASPRVLREYLAGKLREYIEEKP